MFLLYVEGKGYGCDYTIGCNLAVKLLPNTKTMKEAEQAAKEWLADHGIGEDYQDGKSDNDDEYDDDEYDDDEEQTNRTIQSIDIYEIKSHKEFDIQAYLNEINDFILKKKDKKNETKEAEEYKRLKKKFEKK
jgi:hypothetical protein